MDTTNDKKASAWRSWRFAIISLASVVIGLAVVFRFFSPTAGYVQWPGAIVSLVVACCCAVCFFLSPRRPIAPKMVALALLVLPLFSFLLCGCSTPPKLTAEDRKQDIEYLARWARNDSPLVALNEKNKGVPSYETLKPRYVEFAEKAESNEEFYLVASAYFNVIGASGHAYLFPEDLLKWSAVGQFLGICDWGISGRQLWKGMYWPRIARGISTRAHPPFHIVAKEGSYFTDDDWQHNGTTVPSGSRIIGVNGMTCSSYLDFIKTHTHLRYDAFPKDWVDKYLLMIDEGKAFRGWTVEFVLPDGTTVEAFVPKVEGFPLEKGTVFTVDAKKNCTCVELTDAVGYVRIKAMWHGPLSYVFKGYMKKERKIILEFLERGQGKYKKLIIDIRNNGGGAPEYVYENLLCPFLERPLTFKQVAGLRKKYLQDTRQSALQDLKKQYARYVIETREVKPPKGFAENDWTFYEITRQIRPSERYNFNGKLYVLINGGCWSAADDYADLVKRTGLGTLVGQNTSGGGGAYLAPGAIRLPRSGMIFRVETELLMTQNGAVNELFGTEPDVRLPSADPPKSITREDLLKDEWIKHIITDL